MSTAAHTVRVPRHIIVRIGRDFAAVVIDLAPVADSSSESGSAEFGDTVITDYWRFLRGFGEFENGLSQFVRNALRRCFWVPSLFAPEQLGRKTCVHASFVDATRWEYA